MILPIVLDTCTILNVLRIEDNDEFLSKKLKNLDLNISDFVYKEAQKRYNKISLAQEKTDYISQQLPAFATNIKNIEDSIKNDYFEELKTFCKPTKENGELHSTLLSLQLCRQKGTRLYFYTDDYSAKNQFLPYFSYQQIGNICDSVDLLLFLYWSNNDFKDKDLKKYLQKLYSEYATPLKSFWNKIATKKDSLVKAKPKDTNLRNNLSKLEKGCNDLNFDVINEAVDFFKSCKKKYKEINDIINAYPDIGTETEITVKIRDVMSKISNYKILKRIC